MEGDHLSPGDLGGDLGGAAGPGGGDPQQVPGGIGDGEEEQAVCFVLA